MMLLVTVLCAIGAVTLLVIVTAGSSWNGLVAFLTSWVAVMFTALALKAKESAVRRGVSVVGKAIATVIVLGVLGTAVSPYLEFWRGSTGLWTKAFLVWLAVLALMMVWVPLQGGEE